MSFRSAKVPLKIRINLRQFAFQAAAFATKIFGHLALRDRCDHSQITDAVRAMSQV
jgi:hypothetical protein